MGQTYSNLKGGKMKNKKNMLPMYILIYSLLRDCRSELPSGEIHHSATLTIHGIYLPAYQENMISSS